MTRLLATSALVLVSDAALLACPICFQVDDGPTTAGVRAAIWVLIGVTVAVLSGFGLFIRRFVARQSASRREP